MTKIFGILNITPNSFSDGGINFKFEDALLAAKKMVKDGIFAIDIGAESTRPNAESISVEEEISRLEQILPAICKLGIKVSLDTRNFETAKWGAKQGVSIINDVSGFEDERMMELIPKFNLQACFMHSLSIPANPAIIMEGDVLGEIYKWAESKIKLFAKHGVLPENLIFDPGIGFGKSAEQSLLILKNTDYFKKLGLPVLIGHSRKSFLKLAFEERFATGLEVSNFEKDLMTSIFSTILWNKVEFLRLHNTNILKNIFVF